MASSIIEGACNCGAIQVSIPEESFAKTCSLCHCLNCRASSGSLFTVNLPTKLDAVKITGTPKLFKDKAASGNQVDRQFCGDCGSAIMSISEGFPDTAFVKGSLFTKSGVKLPKPGRQIWMRNTETWEVPLDEVPVIH